MDWTGTIDGNTIIGAAAIYTNKKGKQHKYLFTQNPDKK